MSDKVLTIKNEIIDNCVSFSFYHSTSVSLGDSVIIFGGYDHGGGDHTRESLKQIDKVIKQSKVL